MREALYHDGPYKMKIRKSLSCLGVLGVLFSLSACQKKNEEVTETPVSPGKALVMEAIEAHGGAENWYANGDLKFRWTYHMSDRGRTVDTVQVIDPVSWNAVHTVPGSDVTFGRNEGSYWLAPQDGAFMMPAQFWTLTPVYFLGIPFVFNDEGANFELLEETKSFQGKDYTQVKITYGAGSGESPDDHYVLLIDPDSKQVRGTYYTVTSPFVYKGGEVIEKFLSLDGLKDYNGVLLSTSHKTYTMTDGVIGEQMRYTEISETEFLARGETDFSAPEGAKILSNTPE